MADPTKEEIQKRIEDEAKRLWILRDRPVGQDLDIWLYAERTVFSNISKCQKLSESFIREFPDRVNWGFISCYQKLSEEFIKEFKDEMDYYWDCISANQKLSEDFIRKFKNKVCWTAISKHQKLSEDFIREFKNKVCWIRISLSQKLSENFIREFKDKVCWDYISTHQELSEDFIREFKDKILWKYIPKYQKLSEDFLKEFNIEKPKNNWFHATKEEKLQYIKEKTNYQVIDDEYILAYKSTRKDGTSVFNVHYVYEVGKTYNESHCDCNLEAEISFGLSAWTKERALNYYGNGKLFLVKIYIDDIGAIVQNSNKIRCFKLEVLEEVSKDG